MPVYLILQPMRRTAANVTIHPGELLPHLFTLTAAYASVVCFLWHCPAGYPGWLLAITLPCGARTFLERFRARPPSRQIRIDHSARGATPAIGWSPC